jgi:hypothetical protein
MAAHKLGCNFGDQQIILYSRLNKDASNNAISFTNYFDPPLNLKNKSIAMTDFQLVGASLAEDSCFLVLLDKCDSTVRFGHMHLNLLGIVNVANGVSNYFYRNAIGDTVDSMKLTLLTPELKSPKIDLQKSELFVTLHVKDQDPSNRYKPDNSLLSQSDDREA